MSEHQEPLDLGTAGHSAGAEAARRRSARIARRREQFGVIGAGLARLNRPQREQAWSRGADGERRTAGRLARRLLDTPVVLLHDRRIPRSRANIDHIAVGPGGVTVIDSKNYAGKVRTERRGLIRPPTQHLVIAGHDRTALIGRVEQQVEVVEYVLERLGSPELEVRGCLCMVNAEGLPLLGRLQVRGVAILGARAAARLAARPGRLTATDIARVVDHLTISLPPAAH